MRRNVTLSIGTCSVVEPNRFVRMAAGPPPASLRQRIKANGAVEDQNTPEELAWVVRLQCVQLTRCVSPVETPTGPVRLVDRDFGDTKPGEVAIDELSDADLALLLEAIESMTKEADSSARPFPGPQGAPVAGHDGQALRPIAEPSGAVD